MGGSPPQLPILTLAIMPVDNRLSVSDSLKTHDVWQKTVKYDPHGGKDEGGLGTVIPEVGEINSSAKGLFRLAQLTGNSSTLAPGSCKRCGQVGHLFFNCRNYMLLEKQNEVQEEEDEEDEEDDLGSSSSDDEDESSSESEDESSSEDTESSA